jgi:hypothetical protein
MFGQSLCNRKTVIINIVAAVVHRIVRQRLTRKKIIASELRVGQSENLGFEKV